MFPKLNTKEVDSPGMPPIYNNEVIKPTPEFRGRTVYITKKVWNSYSETFGIKPYVTRIIKHASIGEPSLFKIMYFKKVRRTYGYHTEWEYYYCIYDFIDARLRIAAWRALIPVKERVRWINSEYQKQKRPLDILL